MLTNYSTILMMHEDDQLAYCPITHVLAFAIADSTPEQCHMRVSTEMSV